MVDKAKLPVCGWVRLEVPILTTIVWDMKPEKELEES
jgi:hypothetical protein